MFGPAAAQRTNGMVGMSEMCTGLGCYTGRIEGLEVECDKHTQFVRAGLSSRLDPVCRARGFIVFTDTGTLGVVVISPPRRMVLYVILRHQVTWGATIVISPSGWLRAGRERVRDSQAETE